MFNISQFFNITRHHCETPYNSIKIVHTHTIDDELGQVIEEGFIKYVSKMNISRKLHNNDGACHTVLNLANVQKISDYGAKAIHNLNAWHINSLINPIKILNCQVDVQHQLSETAGRDITHMLIGYSDLERLYGPVKHHND